MICFVKFAAKVTWGLFGIFSRGTACSVSYLSREEQEALLLHACHQGDRFVADALITNGCNVNCSIRWESWSFFPNTCTPVIVAAYAGHDQIVKKLILAGAKVGMKDIWLHRP